MAETETKRRILVVSEDEELRDEMTFGFPEHVDISFADDSLEAVRIMQTEVPDLVVMAIRTGRSGGFSLALEMNQRVATQGTPLLLLLERSQDEWLAKQAGVTETLVAPYSSAEIVDRALSALSALSAHS